MHELSIANSLAELAMEAAENSGIEQVKALYLKLGALSGVVKEALEFSFDVAVQGTSLEGAKLIIEDVPVSVFVPTVKKSGFCPNRFLCVALCAGRKQDKCSQGER